MSHVSNLSSGDLRYADAEARLYLKSLHMLASKSAVWVNDPTSQWVADHKLLQLDVARKCGLTIPETLASNSPLEAREFVKEFGPYVVFKPFEIGMWGNADPASSRFVSYAAKLDISDLADDISIIASPGIYQECIDKAYDVRVVVAGQSYLAASISACGSGEYGVDWRAAPTAIVERIELDKSIFEKIVDLMTDLGLLTASIDFVVDKKGDFYFLELNEAGQFLFLEDASKNLPTLRFFSAFLRSPSKNFRWHEAAETAVDISLPNFYASPEFSDYQEVLQRFDKPVGRPLLQD